jgi:hypothetical protein
MFGAIRAIVLLALGGALADDQVDLGLADAQPTCNPSSIGADVSKWNRGFGLAVGHCCGQTFLATDTLIQSITIWRYPLPDTNGTPMHLFIGVVDTVTGYPQLRPILLNGPVLVVPYSDGVHPLPIRFDFDPPFALPRAGRYFFSVQGDQCLGFFSVLADTTDPYPDGVAFFGHPTDCVDLCASFHTYPVIDLIFDIEFCHLAVPTKRQTWGLLKATYR